MSYRNKECKQCNKMMIQSHHNRLFCDDTCRSKYLLEIQVKSSHMNFDSTYPECKICGYRSTSIHAHLVTHKLTTSSYKKKFNVDNSSIYSVEYVKDKSDRIKGDKNPAKGHDGKFSPYSKNFLKYVGLTDKEKIGRISKIAKFASDNKADNHNNPQQIEYYIKRGKTAEEARLIISKNQSTFSKIKCVEKYGKDEGLRIWKDRQIRWQATLNSKSDEDIADINKRKVYRHHTTRGSNIENKLFSEIKNYIPTVISQLSLKRTIQRWWFYDIAYKNNIIEFNGDYWHANPLMYEEENVVYGVKAKDIWDNDKRKIEGAKKQGYKCLIIWENEYRSNSVEVIEKCVNFLLQ